MTKREKLMDVIDATMPVPIPHAILEVAIDAILDELMEPGPGAIEQTADDLLLLKSDVYDCWQAILTHIKAGKP